MMNKENIDNLLQDIQKLEKQISGMRDEEFYLISSFTQSFDLAHKILVDIHSLEIKRLDTLRRQLEEHQRIIRSISSLKPIITSPPVPQPISEVITEPIPVIEEPATTKFEGDPVVVEQIAEQTIEIIPAIVPELEKAPVQPSQNLPISALDKEIETEIVAEKKPTVFFSEILEKKNLSDFRKAFSLNDRFRFKRELFGGDEEKMNQAISDLNDIHSYEDSIAYLSSKLNWQMEEEAVADFIKLLEKRFL